ncbi:MAG: nickel pincer cofactor biosynthesis protein LarB, partial [Candidatus Omnitrophica bacterium]|nr:nickel pincer cofactor biosynthesis protein LarB [Candidatus Omnitrophota bacterium]
AFVRLRHLPYEDLAFAKVDHHRALRTGMPEVVFCQGKSPAQITAIFRALSRKSKTVLLTRADDTIYAAVRRIRKDCVFERASRTIAVFDRSARREGKVSVVCAGTADTPVAEEAAITAEVFGSNVTRLYDVGVAGLHRLLDGFKTIADSRCIVVLAGMDGVLPSVIGGLADCPVIAVPTSVGYGANFSGIAPLLTMLNSCAPNVSVVNVNNGFGAGYIAALINRGRKCPT